MGRTILLALGALVMASGCLDRHAVVCEDGTICAPGTTCVVELHICADPSQVRSCRDQAPGAACTADGIPAGHCTNGVCFPAGCNGVLDEGEACDDGNTVGGDGCSADCRSNETCGNGIVDRGAGTLDEQCDCGVIGAISPSCSGPNSDTDGLCSTTCRRRCGDGAVSADEECDWAAPDANRVACGDAFDRGITTCRMDCTPNIGAPTCRQIGWRTVQSQPVPPSIPVIDVAADAPDHGFFVNASGAGEYNAAGAIPASFHTTTMPMARVWTDGVGAIAVGDGGQVLHWSGTAWVAGTSGTTVDLHDVWGPAMNDVYAAGDASTVIHWNGQMWSTLTTPQVGDLRGLGGDATRLFAVANGGRLLRLDGSGWQVIDTGTTVDLEGVWSTPALVVAVGPDGTIREDDGSGWRAGRTLATDDLHSVWGSEADGFFAVGDGGTILHRDGSSWRPMSLGRGVLGSTSQTFTIVRAVPDAIVGAIGATDMIAYQGAAWSPVAVPTAVSINGLWGTSPDDVFAVGRDGTILHYDGLRWTVQPTDTTVDLHAVHGRAPNDVYAVGDNLTILHHDGIDWRTVRTGPSDTFTGALSAVLASAADNVYAGGPDGLFRLDQNGFTRVSPTKIGGMWAATPTTGWAVGDRVLRLSGGTWTDAAVAVTQSLRAVVGFQNAVYAVGGVNRFYDGFTWSIGPFAESNLFAVSAAPNSATFAVGGGGIVRRSYGPGAVEPFRSRTTADLRAVFAIGHLVFMAGDDGTLDLLVMHQ